MQAVRPDRATVEWGFLGLFVVYVSLFVGLAEIGPGFMQAFREFSTSAIGALWSLTSVPVSCSGTQMTFSGFPMEIVLECTALHYMIIFIAGVLAFSSHSWPYRAIGIIVGTLAIFLLNALRIGFIGFIGKHFSGIFDFIHDYLWQGMFALAVVLLWVLWVNGRKVFSRRLLSLFAAVVVSASLSFFMVVTLLETYVAILAALANIMFPVLSLIIDVPQRVVVDGRLIGYVVGNEVIYSRTTLYFLNTALLLPIASITLVRSEAKLFVKRLCTAAILLFCQNLSVIALDWLLEATAGRGMHSFIIWCIVMSTFIAPMLAWLIAMKIFPADRTPVPEQ